MRIEMFDPIAEPAKVKASYRLLSACQSVDDPHGPPTSEAFFSATLRSGWGDPQSTALASGDQDEVLGRYVLELPQQENRHSGFLSAMVAPAYRRHGVGAGLLRHAAELARGEDRTLLYSYIMVGSPGEAFATVMSGRPGLVAVRRVLDLDRIPAGHLASLRARADQAAAGYSLLSWEGATPEELIDQVAELRNVLADAPHQQGKEVRRVDADWIRANDERSAERGAHRYSVAVKCDKTGELAGLTQTSVEQHVPDWAHQLITAVTRAHRGHRLGLLIKLAMMDLLAATEPGLRHVTTGNAQSNEHMVAINDEIGYRILGAWKIWELDLATVPPA
jgi:RimJ/RimL family protein N-acetyltransferase